MLCRRRSSILIWCATLLQCATKATEAIRYFLLHVNFLLMYNNSLIKLGDINWIFSSSSQELARLQLGLTSNWRQQIGSKCFLTDLTFGQSCWAWHRKSKNYTISLPACAQGFAVVALWCQSVFSPQQCYRTWGCPSTEVCPDFKGSSSTSLS